MWRPAALAMTLIAQLVWVGFCLRHHPPRIETSLVSTSTDRLGAAGLADVKPRFNGRDVELQGTVVTANQGREAEQLVRSVPGIRKVVNLLVVVPQPKPEPVLPYLEIHLRAGEILLKGSVPSVPRRRELIQKAIELFGEAHVDHRLTVNEAAEDGAAMARAVDLVAVASRAVRPSGESTDGTSHNLIFRLRGDGLRLSGSVESHTARQRLEALARDAAPEVRVFFSDVKILPETSPEPPAPEKLAPEAPENRSRERGAN